MKAHVDSNQRDLLNSTRSFFFRSCFFVYFRFFFFSRHVHQLSPALTHLGRVHHSRVHGPVRLESLQDLMKGETTKMQENFKKFHVQKPTKMEIEEIGKSEEMRKFKDASQGSATGVEDPLK